MKIGVVSDTHNNSRNVREIVRLFNKEGVDHVIHTGDITRPGTLELFCDLLAPLSGVLGNNDVEVDELMKVAKLHSFYIQEPPLYLDFCGCNIVVVHDPRDLTQSTTSQAVVALHGHTHQLRMEKRNTLTIFNPGECAGHMKGFNAIGILDLVTMEPRLLKF